MKSRRPFGSTPWLAKRATERATNQAERQQRNRSRRLARELDVAAVLAKATTPSRSESRLVKAPEGSNRHTHTGDSVGLIRLPDPAVILVTVGRIKAYRTE